MTELVVTFDRRLFPNPFANVGNWDLRYNNQQRTVTTAVANNFTVTLTLVPGAADPGVDRVNFAPPPFDLLDLMTQKPVLAFADFPVTL